MIDDFPPASPGRDPWRSRRPRPCRALRDGPRAAREPSGALIAETDPFIDAGGAGDPLLGTDVPATTTIEGDTTSTVIHTPKGDLTRRFSADRPHRRTDRVSPQDAGGR